MRRAGRSPRCSPARSSRCATAATLEWPVFRRPGRVRVEVGPRARWIHPGHRLGVARGRIAVAFRRSVAIDVIWSGWGSSLRLERRPGRRLEGRRSCLPEDRWWDRWGRHRSYRPAGRTSLGRCRPDQRCRSDRSPVGARGPRRWRGVAADGTGPARRAGRVLPSLSRLTADYAVWAGSSRLPRAGQSTRRWCRHGGRTRRCVRLVQAGSPRASPPLRRHGLRDGTSLTTDHAGAARSRTSCGTGYRTGPAGGESLVWAERVRAWFGSRATMRCVSADHYFSAEPDAPSDYRRVEFEVAGITYRLATAGGVFSADRLDPGTAVLLRKAPLPGPDTTRALLDLGCGYGPIAAVLARNAPRATVYAVDVNRRALRLVRENAAALGLADRVNAVTPDEVPAGVRFAGIWSNPPIRVGKAELHAMLLRWLPRLMQDGRAWLVVARHLGADSLQQWLTDRGWSVTRHASQKGYRVLRVDGKPDDAPPWRPENG